MKCCCRKSIKGNRLKTERINQVFEVLSSENPSPQTELDFGNSFQLLIAVILSAQATDLSVNKVTPELFRQAPTPEKMLLLDQAGLEKLIRKIGLYKNKAANILKTCKLLVEEHHSVIPDNRKELENLPGVGPKTAGVVLNVAFGRAEIPVDTHVFRTSNRIGLVKANNVVKTEKDLQRVVPEWIKSKAHHLLILHGRHVCKARKPLCTICCLKDICEYKDKTE